MIGTALAVIAEVYAAIIVVIIGILVAGRLLTGTWDWLVQDDPDDTFSADTETAIQRVALVNDEPDPLFIARTRRLVIDELANRRNQAGAR